MWLVKYRNKARFWLYSNIQVQIRKRKNYSGLQTLVPPLPLFTSSICCKSKFIIWSGINTCIFDISICRRILLNYAIYNSNLGYTQGMSDLLAPILVEIEEEAEAFWCFVGLMQRGMFVCTPTDSDMEHNLASRHLKA